LTIKLCRSTVAFPITQKYFAEQGRQPMCRTTGRYW